jgi:hypothetical protein
MSSNGSKENRELKKNLDYFELSDGIYYTMEGLCLKYDCQHTHIYRRAKEFNIPTETLLNIKVYKDSEHFVKKPKATNNFGNSQVKLVGYPTLIKTVEDFIKAIKESDAFYEQKLNHLTNAVVRYGDNVRENNRLLNEILNYLTTVKMEATIKEKAND